MLFGDKTQKGGWLLFFGAAKLELPYTWIAIRLWEIKKKKKKALTHTPEAYPNDQETIWERFLEFLELCSDKVWELVQSS